ncbi:uncharacterized protein LOC120921655 isoform X1 [Rana temporaria]|uniref:uncharacterized protein LOC120921655 isoform X1 n=2 Tax=Rana temporaria TaxID=8407 RepID=UPI001AACE2E6|nr:uncharacterized protein LOC120921655 isoform X1 [Rana temporaria]
MSWWKRKPTYPAAGLLLLGAVCWGEIQVTSIAYDTAHLPCSFHFIQGLEHLLVVWEMEKDGKSMQVYKSVNGQKDLSNQDSQFRGRTVFSGDISQGKLDLTLVGVTRNDDAIYYCRAANKINHGDNVVVLSVIALPPLMVQKAVEDDVTLVPKFSGVPTEINWKLNNNKLVDMELEPPQSHFYRLADRADLHRNGSLTIRKLTKEDSGAYKSEVIVNNFIQETEIRLAVLDRVSKPTITDSSTDQQIILHCVSSTINVTYKWLVNGKETETTDQEYTELRPKEDVIVSCTVNNNVSENSQSRRIPSGKSEYGRRHSIAIIISATLLIIIILMGIFILVFWFKRHWKCKKYERDVVFVVVEPYIAYPPSNRINLPDVSESGYMCDENRDKTPIEGFQKTEEDQRDAAELEYTGRLHPKYDLVAPRTHKLSSDSDYFSDQSKETPESDCLLEGFQKTQRDPKDDPKYIGNDQSDGYIKFHKTSSDGDFISKKSREAPEPFHVIEER